MSDERDPILDALLEEVLGGDSPPDLKSRILDAHALLPPPSHPVSVPPAKPYPEIQPTSPRPFDSTDSRASGFWLSLAVAASVVAVGTAIGTFLVRNPVSDDGPKGRDVAIREGQPDAVRNLEPRPAESATASSAEQSVGREIGARTNGAPSIIPTPFKDTPVETPLVAVDVTPKPVVEPLPSLSIIASINSEMSKVWADFEVSPTRSVPDSDWRIRVFRRLVGREPTDQEASAADQETQSSADVRAEVVARLFADEAFVEEFAAHWGRRWAGALLGEAQPAYGASRAGLEQHLRRAFLRNEPMDRLATELLTATGTGEPGTDGFNGAANFLLAHMSQKATRTTSHVARAFLGWQVQCAECHDHPGNQVLTQRRFWELNSFLRQLVARRDEDTSEYSLADVSFRGEGQVNADGEVYFETPSGEIKVAYPAFPGQSNTPRTGDLERANRRTLLASYVVASRDFDRTIVNRAWEMLFGFGLEPAGHAHPSAHATLIDQLGEQFAAHDYDLRRLISWIVASEPFGLSKGRLTTNPADIPEFGRQPLFSRFYGPSENPRNAYKSLVAVAKNVGEMGSNLGPTTAKVVDPSTMAGENSLVAAGPLTGYRRALRDSNYPVEQVLASALSFDRKVNHLYLTFVYRLPTRREQAIVDELLKDAKQGETEVLVDVWWALVNSREFDGSR